MAEAGECKTHGVAHIGIHDRLDSCSAVRRGSCAPKQQWTEFMGPLTADDLRALAAEWRGRWAVAQITTTAPPCLHEGGIAKVGEGGYLVKQTYSHDPERWYWRGMTAEQFARDFDVTP